MMYLVAVKDARAYLIAPTDEPPESGYVFHDIRYQKWRLMKADKKLLSERHIMDYEPDSFQLRCMAMSLSESGFHWKTFK